ncbi:LysR substrate-binding domain-containing protein [Aestuariibacter sp. AA17]|uniref:LysR substrate-binding domain-containing protein n=1 Tax=Fluctibacter corallii TaxID=2984329 RepID=A0ABT3A475_9ALTE|nr:LysR substrate-binding domain-containing protein [Aestuariibacter sp. AA17]MCV2883444.1 LysR substrate-binding domain-containing protein [Aestuariibacter sp. AA17]
MNNRLRFLPFLRAFEASARHQSYSKAASELSVTQAAISQQMRNLESQLGVKLFERVGRGMQLTRAGRVLAEHVTDGIETISRGLNLVSEEEEAGVLTVTAPPSFSSYWLVPRLWQFSQLRPDIAIRIVSSTQYEDLLHSDIDVAIRQDFQATTKLHCEHLYSDPVFAFCSPELLNKVAINQPEDVLSCWLVQPPEPTPYCWTAWLNRAGVNTQGINKDTVEITTWEMSINAVLGGQGICLAANSIASELERRGALVRLFDVALCPGVSYSLVYDDTSPRTKRIEAFTQWMKGEMLRQNLSDQARLCEL